jgi:hypothetical protein
LLSSGPWCRPWPKGPERRGQCPENEINVSPADFLTYLIEYLLVDNHKALLVASAHDLLEFNDFLNPLFNEVPLSSQQLFSLLCTLVEESRSDLTKRELAKTFQYPD